MLNRVLNLLKRRPYLLSTLMVTLVFVYTTNRFEVEAEHRKKAFCSLIYLFDQSIRIQNNKDLGPMQEPYDQFKRDSQAVECPKRPNVVIPTTTTTTKVDPDGIVRNSGSSALSAGARKYTNFASFRSP